MPRKGKSQAVRLHWQKLRESHCAARGEQAEYLGLKRSKEVNVSAVSPTESVQQGGEQDTSLIQASYADFVKRGCVMEN